MRIRPRARRRNRVESRVLPDSFLTILLRDLLDPEGRGLDAVLLAGATQDMQARVAGMPRYLGAGIKALSLVFAATGYPRWPLARRLGFIRAWRSSPLSPMRDFVEFYEKMGTFVYWSRVEHAAASEHP